MFTSLLRRFSLTNVLIYHLGKLRATQMLDPIWHFLANDRNILDFGAGTCNVSEILLHRGYQVTSVDIANLSFVKAITPTITTTKLPYPDRYFDTALIFTVLHHTPDPDQILTKVSRVAKKIIVIEDTYTSTFHKFLTQFFDSLFNLEFRHHPHMNRTDRAWRQTFKRLGLKLESSAAKRSFLLFTHTTYCLTTNS